VRLFDFYFVFSVASAEEVSLTLQVNVALDSRHPSVRLTEVISLVFAKENSSMA